MSSIDSPVMKELVINNEANYRSRYNSILTLLNKYITKVFTFEGSCERAISLNFVKPNSSIRKIAIYARTVYSIISDLKTRAELSA